MTRLRRFNPPSAKGSRRRRSGRALLATLLFGLVGALMLPASPASAEVFDTITTPGDGWNVTFHPTNQNYAFFAHHRDTVFGCFYRLDPDGAGPIGQGDGCFDGGYTLDIGGRVGQRSAVWVTSDGNTAYVPRNNNGSNSGDGSSIAKVDITDADPNNWSVAGTVNFASDMSYHSNSVMVDDVLYALSTSGWLTLDTDTDTAGQVAFSGGSPDVFSSIYEADGKLWAVSSDWHLHCLDPADGEPCDHNGWTNGKSTDQFTTGTPDPQAVVEYRNTDGSFGGFCIAHGTNWSTHACLNADGLLDPNAGQHDAMVNPFEQMQNAMGNQFWDAGNFFGSFYVTRQHQVIIHEPIHPDQDYFCWDYTTQAACANFTPSDDNATPGKVYTIIQDQWNDNCFWSNADDKKIGAWNISHTDGFATSGGECDVTFVAETVTLTYDPRGGSGEPGDQTGDPASDVTVSTTEPTRAGYTFIKWNTAADGSGDDYAGGDTYTLPTSGTDTLYAQWQINTVTLTYDPQGGTGEPADQTGDAQSNVTVSSTVPTRDGYTFQGWDTAADGSGDDYAGGDPYTLPTSGTDTLYAQWQINTVTLTYDPQGGTGEPADQAGDAQSTVTVSSTVPTRDGYTFTGWDTAADGSGDDYAGGDPYTLPNSGTDTLYAQWTTVITTPETVTLTYDPQGGTGEPADQTGDAASDVTVSSTVPTRDGYTFTGWDTAADGSGDDYAGGDPYTLPTSGTDTLYAQWQINTVTLTYDPQGGTGEPADQTGDAQSNVTVSSTVPTRDGYTFTGWNTAADGSGTDYSGGDTYTLPNSGTDTLYAQWQINTVTLTYDPQGGTGEPADQTGDAQSNVTVSSTVPTRDGYTFQGWDTAADGSGDDYAGGDPYTLPTSGTDTLYAQWQINTVTLTYDPQGGTGEPADQTGDAQSNVTVSSTVPTRDGYTFQGWDTAADGSGDDYAGGDPYTLPTSGTDTLYAQWQINTVTLTYDPQGGTGEPADQTGDAQSNVTVSSTVPTRDGYTFTGWNTAADGSGTDYSGGDTYTLPNSGTDTLYAQWQINTVTLTYDPRGGTGEPADQTGDAASEVTVSTTEPTRDGYTFTGWNTTAGGSGTDYSGGDTYTLPNSGTDTLYAQWEFNDVSVTLTGDPGSEATVPTTVPTRDGYTFKGWNTAVDGSGANYSGGDTYTLPGSGTVTLYAQWEINTVTLTYDPQGGTGEPADQTGDAASDVTVSATIPTRDGYTFMGWNTAADGSGNDCVGGDTYTLPNSGTDTLYAQWERVATAEAGAPTPVPVLPALLLLLTSLLLAALGIRRFV